MLFDRGITLVGDFTGNRDAGIAFRFRFCTDGMYFYVVHQPGRWRLAHRGSFRTGDVADSKYPGRTLTIIRFEPQYVDVALNDKHAFALLEERSLLADRLDEYIVSRYDADDSWRANVKRTTYSFVRPNVRSRLFSDSWQLAPELS